MSESSGQPPAGHQPGDGDVTREMPTLPPPQPEPSPWSREYGGPGPTYLQPPPPYPPPPSAYAPPGQQSDWPFAPAAPPAPEQPPAWPLASQQGWPQAPQQPWPSARSRRGLWTGVTLVGIAIVATLIAVLVSANSGPSKSSASGGSAQANPPPTFAPTPAPSSTSPQSPLPSLGAVATPPGLLAIGYHAYSLGPVDPSQIALGAGELAQFKKDGLSRVVGLQALTFGAPATATDDWNVDINILRFSSPATAAAELDYSNAQNKKSASTIPLPGFPNATAFVNKGDASTGIGIGAFTTVGRYQVVVILSGLGQNVPTNASAVAAEAARVMRAVLPDAATIVPPAAGSGGSGGGGGTGPVVPAFPTPSPTGTHA